MEDRVTRRGTSDDIAYIFHVIGTIPLQNVIYALESLKNQKFHWKTFILYNGSDLKDGDILRHVPRSKFDNIEIFPYALNTPKSSVADWNEQMQKIGGHDKYFVHKADFYMADGVCEFFENIKETEPWICLFHKFDMKEYASIDTIRKYAHSTWDECMNYPETGEYGGLEHHKGKEAVWFKQKVGTTDGTMHGYTDGVRQYYKPSSSEIMAVWGGTRSFENMIIDTGFVIDDRLFAMHIFHYTSHRADPIKLNKGEFF